MYLLHKPSGELVEVISLSDMINPNTSTIRARAYTEDIIQRAENFLKTEMVFPSGEALPLCWIDSHYQQKVA
jgi:hypothetical protein